MRVLTQRRSATPMLTILMTGHSTLSGLLPAESNGLLLLPSPRLTLTITHHPTIHPRTPQLQVASRIHVPSSMGKALLVVSIPLLNSRLLISMITVIMVIIQILRTHTTRPVKVTMVNRTLSITLPTTDHLTRTMSMEG